MARSFILAAAAAAATLAQVALATATSPLGQRYLLVSAPRLAKIRYIPMDGLGRIPQGAKPRDLIHDVSHSPQGIAVDQARLRLFVADPSNKLVLVYPLAIGDDGELTAGDPTTVSSTVEARWVAVDGTGNLFLSDEPNNRIMKVVAASALRHSAPQVAYDGASVKAVSSPGGVAVDTFYVYWTNKQSGTREGTVTRGMGVAPMPAESVQPLAKNAAKSYGICLSLDTIYYTDESLKLYGVSRSGAGEPAEVYGRLVQPRGCAWDGDGTVFVADRGAGKVYSFPSNMGTLGRADLYSAVDIEDAFGLAVLTGCSARHSGLLALAAALVAALWL